MSHDIGCALAFWGLRERARERERERERESESERERERARLARTLSMRSCALVFAAAGA